MPCIPPSDSVRRDREIVGVDCDGGVGASPLVLWDAVPEVIGAALVLLGLLVGLACYGYGAYIYTQS